MELDESIRIHYQTRSNTQCAEAVLNGDQDDVLIDQKFRTKEVAHPTAHDEPTAVEVHHDGSQRPADLMVMEVKVSGLLQLENLGYRWSVNVDRKAILISGRPVGGDVELGTQGAILQGIPVRKQVTDSYRSMN